MSIEDPRLSSIDNTSAADDFDSAVEQHLGFSGEAADGVELAQAETPETGRTDRLPAPTPSVQTATATIPTEVTPNADNVVTLPAGIELDNLEFQVDGENLVIVLADGTEIVVIGGAANIPTFVIGDVELPQVALFAALEGSNINIAAGPDGTFAAQGTPEASRNFQDDPIDNGPEQFALADLLGNTDFGDGIQSAPELGDNPSESVPFFIAADEGLVDEDYLDDKIIDGGEGERSFDTAASIGTTAEGSLGIVWGRDDDNSIENGGLTGSAGDRGVAFTEDTIAALTDQDYKSDGRSLIYVLSDNDTTLTAYQDGGDGAPVFRVSVSDVSPNGSYEFELLGNLDHPDTSKEDDIPIEFLFRAQDSNGDEGTSRFTVKVNDDSPVQGEAGSGSLTEDDVSEYCATDATSADATTTNAISLGISWGADNDTRDKGDEVGRTVHFVVTDEDDNPTDTGGDGPAVQLLSTDTTDVRLFTDPGSVGLSITGGTFTSGGNVLSYRLTDTVTGGQILTAFYMSTDGESERQVQVDVFQIVLDPLTDNGSATVEIFEELDHDPNSSAPIEIFFQFQATDSDGDVALPGTASVTIADDELVVLGPKWPGFVEEEALDGGNEDIRPILVEGAGFLANQGAIDKTISKSLWIQWGADDSNRVENGGYTLGQTAGDRSVVFDLSSEVATPSSTSQVAQSDNTSLTLEEVASFMSVSGKYGTIDLEDLKSGDASLNYELTGNGTVLTAYTGSGEDRADVFRVTLSDIDDGSYTFELLGVLDHPGEAEGAKNEDVLSFTFDFIARDADGDSDGSSFTVKIIDDCPVASAVTGDAINEALNEDGEFVQVTTTGTLSFLAGADGATVTGISYGLKNVSGAALVEEPYESADDPASQPQLTSGGHPVEVTSSEDGLTLEGTDSEGNLVFTLTVTDPATGDYEFKLLAPIDQPDVDQGGEADVVRLVFNFTVTDGDGDWATNTLKIEVGDSVPQAVDDTGDPVRESAPTPGGNLILAFDVSGSMNSEAVTNDQLSQSRLELAKAAALNLLNHSTAEYVRIVTFSSGAYSTDWMSRAAAIDYITNSVPRPGGDTDYDNAIAAIQRPDANTPGSTVYFFSDGGANGQGQLDAAETTAWEEYLSDRGMTSYAVGVGTHLNDNNDDLGDVAWPGTPITITSADDSDLLDTVPTGTALPTTASGNVVDNDSFGADGAGYVKSITVGGVTYTFDGANTITVSGPNVQAIEGKEITVTSPLGGSLKFNFETGAWDYSAPSDMPENTPETAVETFAYTLVDADGDTSSASLSINVQGVNDAPVNTVPSSQTVAEDTALAFTGARAISVADVDANGEAVTVKLEVKNGALSLDPTQGVVANYGPQGATVTLTGSVTAINTALRSLEYQGKENFYGSDQLKITTIDNGNNGIGGAKADVDTVDITVTPVNDAPVNTVPSSQRVDEDEVLTFRSLSVGDVDANGSDITVTLEVEHGKLTLAKTSGMRVEGNNSDTVTLTGSVSEINAALYGLKYQGLKDFNGSDQLKITTSDNGNSGTGGVLTDIDTVNIDVKSVNDAPVFDNDDDGGRTFSINENTTTVGSVSAKDVDSTTLTYSIVQSRDTDWQKFNIDPSSGAITFKTPPNFEIPTDGNLNNKYWVEVQVSDGSGAVDRQMIQVNVNNVNENPVLNAVAAIDYKDTAADNTFRNATGTLVATDVDYGDSKLFGIDGGNANGNVVTKAGAYGTLSLNAVSGVYTYAPNDGAIEGLKTTDKEQFTFTVTDRSGATSQQTLTINLVGANDTADIGGNFRGTVTEDGTQQTASGQLTVTDRDTGDVGFQAPASLVGTYGDFTFNISTGQWAYALRNSDANVQALKAGDVVYDRLTVLSKDGSDSQVIDVTINGANERPTISASTPAQLVEAGYQQTGVATSSSTLTLGDTDGTVSYDSTVMTSNGWSNNSGTWTKAGLYGVATLNTNTHQVTYTLNNGLANGLKSTDHPVEDFTVAVKDNNNATASVNVSFVINGTNDAPIASVDNVITNAGAGNQFSVAKWALLQNDTDAESDTLGLSVQSASDLTATVSGENVNVTDADGDGGNFTYKASDGSASSGSATVSVTQQQTGALVGTSGSDIMVAVAKPVGQVTTITFASSYDVGDVVKITLDEKTFSHTVVSGGTSAAAVYSALLTATAVGGTGTLQQLLATKGILGAMSASTVTWSGQAGADKAFSVGTEIVNAPSVVRYTQTVDFPTISNFNCERDEHPTFSFVIGAARYAPSSRGAE
jgi:T1SS-143 domain-containing protein